MFCNITKHRRSLVLNVMAENISGIYGDKMRKNAYTNMFSLPPLLDKVTAQVCVRTQWAMRPVIMEAAWPKSGGRGFKLRYDNLVVVISQ